MKDEAEGSPALARAPAPSKPKPKPRNKNKDAATPTPTIYTHFELKLKPPLRALLNSLELEKHSETRSYLPLPACRLIPHPAALCSVSLPSSRGTGGLWPLPVFYRYRGFRRCSLGRSTDRQSEPATPPTNFVSTLFLYPLACLPALLAVACNPCVILVSGSA